VWRQWPDTAAKELTAEQFMEKMDTCRPRIDKAVVFGFRSLSSETPETMKRDNDYILKVVEAHPNRYIGAGLIDPSWGDKAVRELRRVVDAGLRVVKMKFTSVHFHANCKGAQKIFREIERLGVLPLVHSDWTHWSNPLILGDLAMMFPQVKIVMQHFGLALSHDAISVAKKAENVYVDTSAVIHPKNVIRFIREVSPDRVMFASDTISSTEKFQPQDELNRVLCLDLTSEHRKEVLGENAVELLRAVGVDL